MNNSTLLTLALPEEFSRVQILSYKDVDWLSLVSPFEKDNYKLCASSEGLRLCGRGEDDHLFLELYDKELLEKNDLSSGSLGDLHLLIDPTTLLHGMEASCLCFPGLTLRRKHMILPLPSDTVYESVLKYEADRPRKSGYVLTFGVPTEVLERHEFYHVVMLEDSPKNGQV